MRKLVGGLLLALAISNVAWYVKYHALVGKYASVYEENYANDHAATECAVKTGFRYNCADGTQAVSCQ